MLNKVLNHKHGALTLALIVLGVRLLILRLSALELIGDEAHYWEWSRHPALSYYTKGPGVAWVIRAGTFVFGDAEWGIRFPAAFCSFFMTLAIASVARRIYGGDHRIAVVSAGFVSLYPPFAMMASVMTIDAPFLCCWAAAMLLGWKLLGPEPCRRPGLHWAGLGLVLGLGFLAKYTILLLIPGLIIFGRLARNELRGRGVGRGLLVALPVFLLTISPVVIWNQIHHWPTVPHLLGHLRMAGGDRLPRPWHPLATIPEFVGVQILLLGPFALLLWWAFRQGTKDHPEERPGYRYLIWASLPNLIFYATVSVKARVQANWPIPSALGFLVIAAAFSVRALERGGSKRPSPRALKATFAACVVVGLLLPLLTLASPLLVAEGSLARRAPLRRFTQGKRHARVMLEAIDKVKAETGEVPLLITHRYDTSSLLAYYLPGHPRVFSARSDLGGRRSAYDFFPDTNLRDPRLIGRPALLFRGKAKRWKEAFLLEGFRPLDDRGEIVFVAHYKGLRK